jgi:hypothetical protein
MASAHAIRTAVGRNDVLTFRGSLSLANKVKKRRLDKWDKTHGHEKCTRKLILVPRILANIRFEVIQVVHLPSMYNLRQSLSKQLPIPKPSRHYAERAS